MYNIKSSAFKLRKQGKSYNEISQQLKVSKGVLSDWFKDLDWSDKIKKRLIKQRKQNDRERIILLCQKNKERWERWREEARQEAKREFLKLKKNPLFIAGLMIYWGEGDSKAKNPVRLSNTDPRMIALYTKFLTKSLNIPKETLRSTIILYPDLSEQKCMDFWATTIGISKSQFYKTQFIKGKHPTKRLSNGICMISCGNRQTKEKILVWIDLLSKNL